jgi:hypothetical protein
MCLFFAAFALLAPAVFAQNNWLNPNGGIWENGAPSACVMIAPLSPRPARLGDFSRHVWRDRFLCSSNAKIPQTGCAQRAPLRMI